MNNVVLLLVLGSVVVVLLDQLRREIRRKTTPIGFDATPGVPVGPSQVAHGSPQVTFSSEAPVTVITLGMEALTKVVNEVKPPARPARRRKAAIKKSPAEPKRKSSRGVVLEMLQEREVASKGILLAEVFGPPLSRRRR